MAAQITAAPNLLGCCAKICAAPENETKFAWQADKLAVKVRKVIIEIVQTLKPEEFRHWTQINAGKVKSCHTALPVPLHRRYLPLYAGPVTG